ncbi:hypothetical protein YDYSY3_38260 [Paenibacillus chitinolyticus]|uniref:hypothetical protein n=1 Tax=Paenibacillus chitinolyticus TaxID=79263 RepID=UPI0026E4B09D|nr:hypothetical protein [Paenibacillus chitinolyticus]GKS12826.1 hypothetical protein YDYSY3_38260 [Paenibacillus chitinolyticus]
MTEKMEADIIEVDGRYYYLYVIGTHFWTTYLLKKNLKRDARSDIFSLSADEVFRGKIIKRGVPRGEIMK